MRFEIDLEQLQAAVKNQTRDGFARVIDQFTVLDFLTDALRAELAELGGIGEIGRECRGLQWPG